MVNSSSPSIFICQIIRNGRFCTVQTETWRFDRAYFTTLSCRVLLLECPFHHFLHKLLFYQTAGHDDRPNPARAEIIFAETVLADAIASPLCLPNLKKIFDFRVSSEKLLLLKKLHNKYVVFETEQKLFPTI